MACGHPAPEQVYVLNRHATLLNCLLPKRQSHMDARCAMQDFFGGIVAFTPEQMSAVNGFGTNFWG